MRLSLRFWVCLLVSIALTACSPEFDYTPPGEDPTENPLDKDDDTPNDDDGSSTDDGKDDDDKNDGKNDGKGNGKDEDDDKEGGKDNDEDENEDADANDDDLMNDEAEDDDVGKDDNQDDGELGNDGGENDESGDDDSDDWSDDDWYSGDDGDDGDALNPTPNYNVTAWTGTMASDRGRDVVGSDSDIYHELNNFSHVVVVRYNGTSATVDSSNSDVISHIDGAHVTIDLSTNALSGVEIIAVGRTSDGSLKIYGEKKLKLSLYGVDITSKRGPAINSQCKKRIFVNLADGTTNRLTDCISYSDDAYTMPGVVGEDRKGALFTEGHIIVSGYGALVVAGKQKHAIVTDGYYYQRPGSTVVVTEAAKNGIHVKGDSDDNRGVHIAGGAVVASVASQAGKGIKSDLDVVVEGGTIEIKTSGNAYYDTSDQDTSSAAAIKSDTNIEINGGALNLSSSGTGGKGISADGALEFNGGTTNITTSGRRYEYSRDLTSSPKGIKVDGNIVVNSGYININVTGQSEGAEGMESKSTITFNGGETIVAAYDDGINASSAITINDGRIYTVGSNNDGMDSNGTITMNGGLVIGVGSNAPETGIDTDRSDQWKINGGTMIGFGGSMMASPSTASPQCMLVYNGLSATAGKKISILDSSSKPIVTFEYPLTKSGATLLVSTPAIVKNSTFTVVTDGTLSNYKDSWQGWFDGGSWSGGSTLNSFTPTSTITTIGTGGGGGGNWPGGGGNRPR